VISDLHGFLRDYGAVGVLLVLLLLIVQDPERLEKLRALFSEIIFRFFGFCSRTHISSTVACDTTAFYKNHLRRVLPSLPDIRIRVQWVSSASDPILKKDGSLVVFLREDRDQTQNVLAATHAALPKVVIPTLRANLESSAVQAIDLTILRALAERLGSHARPVFQQHFLEPVGRSDLRAIELFSRLVHIDTAGLFVALLLQELDWLGEQLYARCDTSDKSTELVALLDFLDPLVNRVVGEQIGLEHFSAEFSIGVVMLAKSTVALSYGTTPYVTRVNMWVQRGCESIYLLAYPVAKRLFDNTVDRLRKDERLKVMKTVVIPPTTVDGKESERGFAYMALVRPNKLFSDSSFAQKVDERGIQRGDVVTGTVIEASMDSAVVDVAGLEGLVSRANCAWHRVQDCRYELLAGRQYAFVVLSVNGTQHRLLLSRQVSDEDPWTQLDVPAVGALIEVAVTGQQGNQLICRYLERLDVVVPLTELSWTEDGETVASRLADTHISVLVYSQFPDQRCLYASLRNTTKNPWSEIQKTLPTGTRTTGVVTAVFSDRVTVKLPQGVSGSLPGQCLTKAGFEYADYTHNIVVGQRLDVVVTKLQASDRTVLLDLARNVFKPQ
jgi:hypothetical protein